MKSVALKPASFDVWPSAFTFRPSALSPLFILLLLAKSLLSGPGPDQTCTPSSGHLVLFRSHAHAHCSFLRHCTCTCILRQNTIIYTKCFSTHLYELNK